MSASSKFFSNSSRQFTGKFKHWMENHPIISNSVLCLNLWIVGDFAAQYSEYLHLHDDAHSDKDDTTKATSKQPSFVSDIYDPKRTAQCAGYGATVTGPILATWYPFMEKMCAQYNVTARFGLWGAPVLKVLADEFIMDPPTIALFFGYMNMVEGGTMETFVSKIREQFFPSWCASLAVWPFVLLGTFRFVPLYAQAPLINACCIVWDAFLSHRNFLSKLKGKEAQQEKDKNDEEAGPILKNHSAEDEKEHVNAKSQNESKLQIS